MYGNLSRETPQDSIDEINQSLNGSFSSQNQNKSDNYALNSHISTSIEIGISRSRQDSWYSTEEYRSCTQSVCFCEGCECPEPPDTPTVYDNTGSSSSSVNPNSPINIVLSNQTDPIALDILETTQAQVAPGFSLIHSDRLDYLLYLEANKDKIIQEAVKQGGDEKKTMPIRVVKSHYAS